MLKPCIAAIIGITLLATAHAQVYQWRDAKGRIHFGDQPPTGVSATLLRPGVQAAPPTETQPTAAAVEVPPPPPEEESPLLEDESPAAENDTEPLPEILDEPVEQATTEVVAPPPAPPAEITDERTPLQLEEDRLKAVREEREKANQLQAQAEEEKQLQAALERDCAQARNQLIALEGGQRFARLNERGERVVLDDAARAAEVARMREFIGSRCTQ